MKQEDLHILRQFQQEPVRMAEQEFASILTERSRVNLFFINENEAFTDGNTIVVDPAMDELFTDNEALFQTEKWLGLSHRLGDSRWLALGWVTRAQLVHECLHILYSAFPPPALTDQRGTTRLRLVVLALISNIVEDGFIEAVGCSVYDNLELYLLFGRLSRLYCNNPSEGTVERRLKGSQISEEAIADSADETEQQRKGRLLSAYLNYMASDLLYPMLKLPEPEAGVAVFVEETKDLFRRGMFCGSPKERFRICQEIFDKIESLIPESEQLDDSLLKAMLGGVHTHSVQNSTIADYRSEGKTAAVDRGLFFDRKGKEVERQELEAQWLSNLREFQKSEEHFLQMRPGQNQVQMWEGNQFDCAVIHHQIEITEIRTSADFKLAKAYRNIYEKYRITIHSYNSRFAQLLKGKVPIKEEKLLIGSSISSKHLSDPEKRYWVKHEIAYDTPELAILVLIDGSGSMEGKRCDSARQTCVILHEVLKKQGIQHAIAEHRALPGEPKVNCKLLLDFGAKSGEKYNILRLSASGNTREGLVLFWAESYLNKMALADNRLILVVSDGLPCHFIKGDHASYAPPVSTIDTANACRKIGKRGTDIVAIALDDGEFPCYDDLKQIYPTVIACTDLNRLTGQILGVITKKLMK